MSDKVKKDQESKRAKAAHAPRVTKRPSNQSSGNAKLCSPQSESTPSKPIGEEKASDPTIAPVNMVGAIPQTSSSKSEAPGPYRDSTDLDSDHITFQSRLPMTYTSNVAPLFDQLYLSNLIVSYTCPEGQKAGLHIWVSDLPQMLSSWENPAIAYSSRATSMALYGRLTKSADIALQARKYYAKCLQLQRGNFQREATEMQKHSNSSSLASIAATHLLAVFESIVSTAPDGWVHHFSAAIRMLILKGPTACQRGLANQLFRSLRLGSVLVGMTTRKPSPFDQADWHTLPFVASEKTHLDDLVDILVQLPSCSFKMHEWHKARSLKKSRDLRRQILDQTESLLLQLDHFSELYDIECSDTAFQATFAALFHSASLICLNYHNIVASVGKRDELQMEEHAEMILKCATCHKKAGIQSGGSFNMSFPLKIASLMAPSEEIRDRAQEMISSWGDQRGLRDLFEAAYPLCT